MQFLSGTPGITRAGFPAPMMYGAVIDSTCRVLQQSVEKTWSWNGRLFATLKNGQKLLVRPFQLLEDCTVCQ